MTDRQDAIDEAAAAWVVRLNADGRSRVDQADFRAWMEQDPAHALAFADCSALWEETGELARSEAGRLALRRLRAPRRVFGLVTRRSALLGGGALTAAAAAGAVTFVAFAGEQAFQTAPGEQKRVRLADGSRVLLNTDSRLRVKLVRTERRLYLDRGQAFFQVAKDRNRPFRVFAGRDEVRALGTAFDVRRTGDTVLVTLEEGRVAVFRDSAAAPAPAPAPAPARERPSTLPRPSISPPATVLAPGEQASLQDIAPVSVRRVDLRAAQAWRYGQMILDDAPLGDTVADLNRYGGVQIVLSDPRLASLRVSGVFHTGRPDDFVIAVTTALPIEVARQDADTIVLKSR
jgi:transmembrane sensor